LAITQTTAIAKVRLRLQDRSTRRDGTAITTPRYSDTDIGQAITDAIRSRQPLIEGYDKSWYTSVFDFIGVTNAIASSSSTTLPIASNEQYAAPSNAKQALRLARRDLAGYPSVRKVEYADQDQIYYGGAGYFAGFYADHGENLAPDNATWSWVTENAGGTLTNRIRILPAPAATSYLYRFWFIRIPTEPSSGSHTLDCPPDFIELVALDAAIELAGSTGDAILPTLVALRNMELEARESDYKSRFAGRRVMGDVRL
jgi:hypothetical protein